MCIRDSGDTAAADEAHLKALVKYTALSFKTSYPVCFGALIVDTQSGKTLMRGRNAVARENDPSAHAELRTVQMCIRDRYTPSPNAREDG